MVAAVENSDSVVVVGFVENSSHAEEMAVASAENSDFVENLEVGSNSFDGNRGLAGIQQVRSN